MTFLERRKGEVGMVFFLMAEAMLFAGLVASSLVLKASARAWPPAGQPRLPVTMTGFNTAILIFSGLSLIPMYRALKKGCRLCFVGWLGLVGLGGALFLSVQGYEWVRLIQFGLSTANNVYGGLFYLLVGMHGLHVAAGLATVLFVFFQAIQGRYTELKHGGLNMCSMYWGFVVVVWPILYAILYF